MILIAIHKLKICSTFLVKEGSYSGFFCLFAIQIVLSLPISIL